MKLRDELDALEKAAVDVRKTKAQKALEEAKKILPDKLQHIVEGYEKSIQKNSSG